MIALSKARKFWVLVATAVLAALAAGLWLRSVSVERGRSGKTRTSHANPQGGAVTVVSDSAKLSQDEGKDRHDAQTKDNDDIEDDESLLDRPLSPELVEWLEAQRRKVEEEDRKRMLERQGQDKAKIAGIDPAEIKISEEEAITIAYQLLVGRPETGIPLMQWAEFYALVEPHLRLEKSHQAVVFRYIVWKAVVPNMFRFEIDVQTGFLQKYSSFQRTTVELTDDEWEEYERSSCDDFPEALREKVTARVVQEASFSLEQAFERVRKFLRGVYSDFSERNFQDVGSGVSVRLDGASYFFNFREMPREGERLVSENRILVDMNPVTGVVNYWGYNDYYVLRGEPKISKEQASQIAAATMQAFLSAHPGVQIVTAQEPLLGLWPWKAEPARIRPWWQVPYRLRGAKYNDRIVWVDAETGEALTGGE